MSVLNLKKPTLILTDRQPTDGSNSCFVVLLEDYAVTDTEMLAPGTYWWSDKYRSNKNRFTKICEPLIITGFMSDAEICDFAKKNGDSSLFGSVGTSVEKCSGHEPWIGRKYLLFTKEEGIVECRSIARDDGFNPFTFLTLLANAGSLKKHNFKELRCVQGFMQLIRWGMPSHQWDGQNVGDFSEEFGFWPPQL